MSQKHQRIPWQNITIAVANPLLLLVLLPSLLGYLGQFHLIFELLSHFRLQYFLLSILPLLMLLLVRAKPWMWLALFCLTLNGIAIVPWYIPRPIQAQAPSLRMMVSNVLSDNQNYTTFANQVQAERPDLLVVLELNEAWSQQLTQLNTIFPYQNVQPREDNFGIALYSQFPLSDIATPSWSSSIYEVPSITANVAWQENVIHIVATHPLPPINQAYLEGRNSQLQAIAQHVKTIKQPAIIAGDLNITMWSPFYRAMVRQTNLKNSRAGFGLQPTWPSDIPLLQIPIDHILLSPDFTVQKSRRGESVGSDHYPLIADVTL